LREALQRLVGDSVRLIDTAAAVARQTANVLPARQRGTASPRAGRVTFFTSGDPRVVQPALQRLWAEPVLDLQRLEA
jgi:glutamate racemase